MSVAPVASVFSVTPLTFRNASDPSTACAPSCAITVPCLTNCQPASMATAANAASPVTVAAATDNGAWVRLTIRTLKSG